MRYFNEKAETMPREELSILQSTLLCQQIKHVYDNVELYRRRMDEKGISPEDIKGIEDLHKLPFTVKADLRDTYPYGMFAVPMEEVIRLHASSGTTGKQIVVGYTKDDIDIWSEICARALAAAGADKNDMVHVSYGFGLFTGGFGLYNGSEKLGSTAIPVSSGNTQRQVTIFKDFGSTVLCSTPSYAMHLAETMQSMGVKKEDISLKAGIFGAEPWTEEMRRKIEEMLGIKAYDIYGLTEVMGPGVSYECKYQCGMHVNEDHFIVEVIDPDTGKVLPEGETGELVFTSLTKKAFPVIRYRTRDIGKITKEKCTCGRTFLRMTKPMGRTDDMLIIRGVNVFPSQIETVLVERGFYTAYQIVVDRVDNSDTCEVKVELPPETSFETIGDLETISRNVSEALKSLLGIVAKVTLLEPNSIPRSEGKAVRVIDKRKLYS